MRGKVGPVPLIRTKDMLVGGVTPGQRDRKLGPSERIQQRGVDASEPIIRQVMQNMPFAHGDRVLLFDMFPNPVL